MRALCAAVALVVVASLVLGGVEAQPLDPRDPAEFAIALERIGGGGGTCNPGCPLDLRAWQAEILPWLVEEGVVAYAAPPKPTWRFHEDENANHVLGQSDCGEGLWMNARYVNQASPWYRDVSFLSTFVHELVHSQQGIACDLYEREKVEATAVVVSLEVMAAMANSGNRAMAEALVDELQAIALGELRYRSLRDKDDSEIESVLDEVDGDAWDRAERRQRARYWADRPFDRAFVLRAYAHTPYALLVKAVEKGALGEDLALAPISGGYDPTSYEETFTRPVVRFDDLAYFLEHAEELLGPSPEAAAR